MADKKVTIEIGTNVEDSEVDALENEIQRLRNERLQFQIDTNTSKLEQVKSKIQELENKKATLDVDADDSEIQKIEAEIEKLKFEEIDLDLKVRQDQLEQVDSKIDSMDPSEIDVDVNNISAMQSIEQIGQGFDRLKQGASEIGEAMGTMLDAAGKQETNKTFLEMSVGADQAAKSLDTINTIVQKLPGDDTALQGLLSSAAAKNASLTASEMEKMGVAAADYFSAMTYYGKTATEAQQDMTNYLLAGDTAGLERSPVMQSHIDKLKEASTVQERINALQEALNEEGWAGMSQQDTYNNKLETFNGMLERGKYNLGGMFQEGAKWGMDFVMALDDASGGLVGMSIALASFASPITDTIMGLGQIATGLNALRDAGDLLGLSDKLNGLKNTIFGLKTSFIDLATQARVSLGSALTSLKDGLMAVGSAAKQSLVSIASFAKTLVTTAATAIKNAVIGLGQLAKEVLLAGINAAKSAAMWVVEKAALVASTIAEYAAAAAQWALNIAMDANPIGILIIAITALVAILGYLYFNNEQVRTAIDGLGQTLMNVGQIIYGFFVNAINMVISVLQGLWNYIVTLGGLIPANVNITGNMIMDTIIRVITFVATLPVQLAVIFANIIAKALGFGNNFVQTLINGAVRAVTGFIQRIQNGVNQFATAIQGIKTALQNCLDWAYNLVMSHPLVQALAWLGNKAAEAFSIIGLRQGSPGKIYHALENELNWSKGMVEDSVLPDTTAKLGKDMADSFSPDFSIDGVKFANGSIDKVLNIVAGRGNGDIIINIEGDVDSDKRVNQIIEVIQRELNWDNSTAGRTI